MDTSRLQVNNYSTVNELQKIFSVISIKGSGEALVRKICHCIFHEANFIIDFNNIKIKKQNMNHTNIVQI